MNAFVKSLVKSAAAVFLAAHALWVGAGETAEVAIVKMEFVPEHVKIQPGTTVKWVNIERRMNHSVLFDKEGLDSGKLAPGESWQRTFDKPGLYPYLCEPHPDMTGVVEVVE